MARRTRRTLMKTKDEPQPSTAATYLVIWWMSKAPYAAMFTNRVAAEAAANVRNALLVTISGGSTKVEEVVDWYRRDDAGRPMPAEWRELMGHVHSPWHARTAVRVDGVQTELTATADAAEA
jgi:hypothetical protein